MKIGPKIALFYSLITMCAIIMVMSVFYLFSSRYINRLYESYLRECQCTRITRQKRDT